MKDYPHIGEEEGSVVVEFAPSVEQSNSRPLDMVLDFGQSGEVMGIEIINLVFEAGKDCLRTINGSVPTKSEGLRYAYDEDSDSFYLRLRPGRSFNQKSVKGSMFLDTDGRITGLSAKWQ
jgi:uncharacterized protein YuzE